MKDDVQGIKCVVWDLDDTLWQGTLMEGDDVVMSAQVRQIVDELDRRGVLQSISSKNWYAPAWEKLVDFGVHAYFLHPQINWASKSDSIQSIGKRLGIGLDTFAFVDDQAFEREEVRHVLPDVTTIDAVDIGSLLDMPRMLPRFITDESRMRRRIYQADVCRQQHEEQFVGAREDFLATLGMRLTIREARETDLRRAEELTIRTNQLNTTGRSYSYATLSRLIESPEHIVLVAELDDRFGASGTIGLVLLEQQSATWNLNLFIMSCRVLTRGVGGAVLSCILESARRRGVSMRAEFIDTGRNRMMYATYKFHEIEEKDGLIVLAHDLGRVTPCPAYITICSESASLI
jgi:FkbH-like protein